MPSSRFDTSQEHQYVSSYIPLPFETISALGANMQAKHDRALDDTYKLGDLMAQVPAIHDSQLGLSNIKKKQELDAKYHPRIDVLANKIAAGDSSATKELEQVKRDFINDPDRQELENSYINYKAYKEDKTKKGDKYAEYKDAYKGQSLIDETTGELKPFRFSGMGEVQDHASEARDQMKDIAKMGYDSKNSHLEADGNIYTRDSHGKYIKDTRVRDLANYKAGDFIKTEKGKDFLDLIKYQNPNATPKELHKRVSDYLFNAGSNQIFSDIGGGNDVNPTVLTGKIYDKKETVNSLIGQTIEGQTYNPIENDKEFKDLKDSGVLNIDKNGLVKINWMDLNKESNQTTGYSTSYMGPGMGTVTMNSKKNTSNDKQIALAKQMHKMANVVGYQGKIDSDHYELIASAYNILSKARLFGEQLSAPVSNLESDKITRNWDQTTSFDPTNINKLAKKPKLKEGDKIVITERHTNKNGELIKKGNIVNKDGTRIPIALKSNSLEDSGFFDKIGDIGITSAKYQVGEIKGSGERTADGKELIHETNIPYVGDIITVANPRHKSQIEYRLVTKDGHPHKFNNYSDLQRFLESEYYTKTPEGQSDTQELINKKKQFETNFEQ